MSHDTFTIRSRMPVSAAQLFDWHEKPGSFQRLSPPYVNIVVLEQNDTIMDGARVLLHISKGPVGVDWLLEHKNYVKHERFADFQVKGPLTFWEHQHRFVADGAFASFMEDHASYELPAGFNTLAGAGFVMQSEIQRLFRYRHRTLQQDFEFSLAHKGGPSMRIAVNGTSGLVGSQLIPFLSTQGHSVLRLVRASSKSSADTIGDSTLWNPEAGLLDIQALEGCNAIVNLAGDNIASDRWTDQKKKRLRASRIESTRLICQKMAQMKQPPEVFLSASAIGYYGDRGDEALTEESSFGRGFLAELCEEWESTALEAEKLGVRVVTLRIGVVLSPRGGALAKMITPFQLGAGGPIGSGQQYFSWIAIDDLSGAILHCLLERSITGAVNALAPNPVTNQEYTRVLGRVLHRPAVIPMPALAVRLAFGEMADECLLASQRVYPKRLEESGYKFRFPELEKALRHVLGKDEMVPESVEEHS